MNDVIEGIETFYKRCENCLMCYRYQENDRSIHNFNDTFLIGFDVCPFLQQCLQEHLPIGSIVNVLESQLGKRLHSQSVIDAYLHFDSLSQHTYEYSCTLCGYHPKILIMDLNKKVAFNFNVSNLELPENYQMDDADFVDCDVFWGKVELSMIFRGFLSRTIPEFEVNPNLLFWSPFIGRHTRKGPLLLNTKHRKVSRSTGELESDCREISEERLLELLHNSTYKEVKKFAQSISTHPKGSKLDVIMQIKQAISKDDETLKAFNKIWGHSGGWVSGTCQHGVIYALKFVLRAESPRDYIDLILSMAHQPNIVVSDMANMLVAHGQKRNRDMFNPDNGMVVAPIKENVQEALEGRLEVSLPRLNDNHRNGDDKCSTARIHPVTGNDQHLCLFDRLHERNAKKDEEVLKRVRNVKELKGNLNTQKDEQLHLLYNHDTRYLNQMKPVNHIFLFRSNIDIHNERINRRQKDGLRAAFKHEIKVDENGRAVLDKTIKLVVKRKGHHKRNIPGDIDDDDAQHATPKKMKHESSDLAILKMMVPESSVESVSGTENQPTDTQQATPKKGEPESSEESVSGAENQKN